MIVKPPRNKDGKFKPFSVLSNKNISCRIFKNDEAKFYEIVEKYDTTPSELIRKIIHEWLENNYE